MQKSLQVGRTTISYTIRRSRLSRRLRLTIDPRRGVVVSMPIYASIRAADLFVLQNSDWIYKHLKRIAQSTPRLSRSEQRKHYLQHKEAARKLVLTRLAYFNQYYQFAFKKIAIRNQTTRWGSCSSSKNLNFNYKLALIDPELSDYVIVHELCHLKQMNHSKAFWDLVAETIPDYRTRRKKLKALGLQIS